VPSSQFPMQRRTLDMLILQIVSLDPSGLNRFRQELRFGIRMAYNMLEDS
jgi:hypothetical protein